MNKKQVDARFKRILQGLHGRCYSKETKEKAFYPILKEIGLLRGRKLKDSGWFRFNPRQSDFEDKVEDGQTYPIEVKYIRDRMECPYVIRNGLLQVLEYAKCYGSEDAILMVFDTGKGSSSRVGNDEIDLLNKLRSIWNGLWLVVFNHDANGWNMKVYP